MWLIKRGPLPLNYKIHLILILTERRRQGNNNTYYYIDTSVLLENIPLVKFISSSRRVMSFLLCRQKDIDKIIDGNYRNYVIDKLTCEIMENKPLGSRM